MEMRGMRQIYSTCTYPSSFQLKALYIHFNIIRINSKLYLNFNRPHHDKNIFIVKQNSVLIPLYE